MIWPLNKKKYLILFAVFVLLVSGVFAFYWWQHNRQANTWALVPDHAVIVIESKNPLHTWQNWQEKKYIEWMKPFPYFENLSSRIQTLQESDEPIEDFLEDKTILSSLHVTARDNFDFLFYIPVNTTRDQEVVSNLITEFRKKNAYRYTKRNFQGFQITELFSPKSQIIFSFIVHKQVLIGSYTPFLVEDVIRTLNEPPSLEENTWTTIKNQTSPGTSDVAIYVQPATLPRLVQIFAGREHASQISLLDGFSTSVQLQAIPKAEQFMLEGLSNTDQHTDEFLDIFNNQQAQPIACIALIPANTAILYHWGFHDAHKLGASLQNYWSEHKPGDRQKLWQNDPAIRPEMMFRWMHQEIVLAIPESNRRTIEKLLFIQTKDITEAMGSMDQMADAIDQESDANTYSETYADVPIRQINMPDFPAQALGSFFNGFQQCFYAPIDNYIVFSNTIQSMKKLLDDIDKQQVWAYSINKKEVIRQMAGPDNFSLFVHTTRAWNLLYQNASPKWQSLMKAYTNELKKIEYITLQIHHADNQTYKTSLHLKLTPALTAKKTQNTFFTTHKTSLAYNSVIAPRLVRNHVDKSWEVLIQDVKQQLYLIDAKGKVIWKKPFGKRILTDVSQVDFYKNNKLQYLFATDNAVFIVDRNGNPIDNFPISLADTVNLHTISALDYDKNRNYRFLASDVRGNLYMYSKEAQLLDGWNPLRLGYRLNSAARHIRVKGKDYIIMCQANGSIQVLNRKGQSYPGFPVKLQARTNSPLYIEIGIDATHTFITALTDNGEVNTFDLLGTLTARKQLYRPSKTTRFTLCAETSGKDWLIVRHEDKSVSILDKQGLVLFEKASDAAGNLTVQYYDFGADLRIIAITDPASGQTYLYDDTGKIIGDTYIKNQYPISVLFIENFEKLLVYHAEKQTTGVASIKIK